MGRYIGKLLEVFVATFEFLCPLSKGIFSFFALGDIAADPPITPKLAERINYGGPTDFQKDTVAVAMYVLTLETIERLSRSKNGFNSVRNSFRLFPADETRKCGPEERPLVHNPTNPLSLD